MSSLRSEGETMLTRELTIVLWLLWASGGVSAIILVAYQEQRRLGGRLFSHLVSDIEEAPLVATIGYLLVFIGSWFSFVNKAVIEK